MVGREINCRGNVNTICTLRKSVSCPGRAINPRESVVEAGQGGASAKGCARVMHYPGRNDSAPDYTVHRGRSVLVHVSGTMAGATLIRQAIALIGLGPRVPGNPGRRGGQRTRERQRSHRSTVDLGSLLPLYEYEES